MTLNDNQYLNCSDIIIDSVLKRFNINSNLFWNEIGLYYSKNDENIFLTSSLTNKSKKLSKYGLTLVTKEFNTSDEFITEINRHLSKGQIISVKVDNYELPYCLSYKQSHMYHAFEILEYNVFEKNYYINDHFYMYEGFISENELVKAFTSALPYTRRKPLLYYVLQEGNSNKLIEDFNEVREININALEGNYSELLFENTDFKLGLDAISEIQKDILALIHSEKDYKELDSTFGSYFSRIKDIAGSRYNFALCLREYNHSHLADLCELSYQNWMAFANIILRYMYTNKKENITSKIEKRINKIYLCEHEILNELKCKSPQI